MCINTGYKVQSDYYTKIKVGTFRQFVVAIVKMFLPCLGETDCAFLLLDVVETLMTLCCTRLPNVRALLDFAVSPPYISLWLHLTRARISVRTLCNLTPIAEQTVADVLLKVNKCVLLVCAVTRANGLP
jgi:hypothetical protein